MDSAFHSVEKSFLVTLLDVWSSRTRRAPFVTFKFYMRWIWIPLAVIAAILVVVWGPTEWGRFSWWLDHEQTAPAKAQTISAITQAIAGVLALAVTIVYVILTRDIAKTSASQLEASVFPMLQFRFEPAGGGVSQVDVYIKNTGQAAVKIVYCAFGGKVHTVMHPTAGGEVRLESIELKELEGTILGKDQEDRKTVDLRPKGVPERDWGSVLMSPKKYELRVDCTDPRGVTKHSFVRRADGRTEYYPYFARGRNS